METDTVYNHAPEDYVCPFCSIIHQQRNERVYSAESDVIYRDESVIAMISAHQWANNPGNVIVMPNEHFENIYDLPLNVATQIHRVARLAALAMKAVYACDGISTRQHNEPAGSQDVWHYHMHVTPRYSNDGFYRVAGTRQLMPLEERAEHAQRLRSWIAQHPAD